MKINWSYLAGYFDGEGCIMLGITKEKRPEKKKGSIVDGWNITPSIALQTYDFGILQDIKDFLLSNGFIVSMFYRKASRFNQTQSPLIVGITGWNNLKRFSTIMSKYSIGKKPQFDLFLSLCDFREKYLNGKWTKNNFILAMNIVDNINSHKSRIRGKYNANFFKNLWSL